MTTSKYIEFPSAFTKGERKINEKLLKKAGNSTKVAIANSSKTDIHFYGLHVQKEVRFTGFITEFSDSYNSNWQSTPVYGRMDPIPVFESTQRSLSLGFKIVNGSISEAGASQYALNNLIEMLFPKYTSFQNIKLLNGAPILRIKCGNLITNSTAGIGNAESQGVAGYITDFNVNPNLEEGMIATKYDLVPKVWEISLSFQTLHDETPGFDSANRFMITSHQYPYGGPGETSIRAGDREVDVIRSLKTSPGAQARAQVIKDDTSTASNQRTKLPEGSIAQKLLNQGTLGVLNTGTGVKPA